MYDVQDENSAFFTTQQPYSLQHNNPTLTSYMFKPFGFIAPKTLYYLSFQSFDFEGT